MKVNRGKTQEEIDSGIPHDPQSESSGVEASTPYTAPTEADKNSTDQPLIGDHDTVGTTLKPIC